MTAGVLPNGLVLDPSTGDIAGTPTESGTYDIDVTASDANSCTGTMSYQIVIACAVITLSPPTQLPDGYAGIPYLVNITGNGGTAPYKYEVVTGTMPTGIFLGEGGTLWGVPEAGGSKNFRIRATDVNGCFGEQAFRLDFDNCFDGAIMCEDFGGGFTDFTTSDECGGDAEWYSTNACPSSDDIGHTPSAHARWGMMGDCSTYATAQTEDYLDSVVLDVSNCNSGFAILSFNYLLASRRTPPPIGPGSR